MKNRKDTLIQQYIQPPQDEGATILNLLYNIASDQAQRGRRNISSWCCSFGIIMCAGKLTPAPDLLCPSSLDGYVHRGVTCSACRMAPLRGVRFKASLSLTHTHSHTHTHSLSHTLSHSLSLSLFFVLFPPLSWNPYLSFIFFCSFYIHVIPVYLYIFVSLTNDMYSILHEFLPVRELPRL